MIRETLIRLAFQCLQLVITDFLPVMPWRCLPLCVDTVAKFGSQTQELNISLTAVGLMVSFVISSIERKMINICNTVEHLRLFSPIPTETQRDSE